MFQAIRYSVRQHGHAWLPVALGAGLVVLYITNIFTPYLNHPIGLGFMLFVLPFLDFDERKAIETATEIRAKQKAPRLQKQEAGITASN